MSERRRMLAVLGPAQSSEHQDQVAALAARTAAQCNWVVLSGGGPGVMSAASRAACEASGLSVGILPVAQPTSDYPNPWVQIPVFTGSGSARNAFNVLSADLCVAIGGGFGTLSEIALALKAGTEVWCYRSWQLTPPVDSTAQLPRHFNDAEELVAALQAHMVEAPDSGA